MNLHVILLLLTNLQWLPMVTGRREEILSRTKRRLLTDDFIEDLEDNDDYQKPNSDDVVLPLRQQRAVVDPHEKLLGRHIKQRVNDDAELLAKLQRLFKEIQKRSIEEETDVKKISEGRKRKMVDGGSDKEVESGSGSGSSDFDNSGSGSDVNANVQGEDALVLDKPKIEDYSSLFNKVIGRRSVRARDTDDLGKDRRKRGVEDEEYDEQEVDEKEETDFEGLPEALATVPDISKQKRDMVRQTPILNTRAMILKRQARDRIVPNIPLPFNHVNNDDPITKAKIIIGKVQAREFSNGKQGERRVKIENKSVQGKVMEKTTNSGGTIPRFNLARVHTLNASVTNSSGDKEVVRGARSLTEEVTNHMKTAMKIQRNDLYTKSINFEELKSLDIVKRALSDDQFNRLRFIDEEKAKSLFDHTEGNFLKNLTKDGIYYDTRNKRFLLSADATQLGDLTKNLTGGGGPKTQGGGVSSLELAAMQSNITKREIILDSDPEISSKMEDRNIKLERENVRKAEEVYRFARDVLDVVGDLPKMKGKRQVVERMHKPAPIKGMWAALGSIPEFVPGLVKRNYVEESPQKMVAKTTPESASHDKKQLSLFEIRQKRRAQPDKKKNKEQGNKLKMKRTTAEKGSEIYKQHAESPVSVAETGNLGSVNFGEVKKHGMIAEQKSIGGGKEKSKRQDTDSELGINHMTTPTSSDDGRVIFAFDEVKELMPTRTYSSLDEEKLLKPQKITETRYDIDKDLADSMLVSRETIPTRPVGSTLIATNVAYQRSDDGLIIPDPGLITNKNNIPILKKDYKIGAAQISKYHSEHEQPKLEQMQRWFNDTILHPFNNEQSAETDAALQKLNLDSLNSTYASYKDNKGETSSEYLAKSLQDKIKADEQDNQVGLDELNRDILKEQQKYKVYLEQQKQQRLQEAQQKQQDNNSNDLETQSQSTQEMNPYLPTVQNNHQENTNSTPTTNQNTNSTPTTNQNTNSTPTTNQNNTTAKPATHSNEDAMEHFERVHGYDNLSTTGTTASTTISQQETNITTTPSITAIPIITTTAKPVTTTSTVSPVQPMTTTTVATSSTTQTTPSVTTTTSTSTGTPIVTTKVPTTTLPAQVNTTQTPTLGVATNTTTDQWSPTVAATTMTTQNTTLPTINSNSTTLPIVIPILESNESANQTVATQQQPWNSGTYYQPQTIAQQSLATWQQQRPMTINSSQRDDAISPSSQPTPREQQSTKTTPLPYSLEVAYRPQVLTLPKNESGPEITPRVDGYIGCYVDRLVDGRDLPVRAGLPLVTPNTCRSVCKKTGYRYAAVQYGYLCFCGNMYGKYDMVPDHECNTVCSGNVKYTCGGLWRNKIYSTEGVNNTELMKQQYTDENGATRSFIPLQTAPDDPRQALKDAVRMDYEAAQYEANESRYPDDTQKMNGEPPRDPNGLGYKERNTDDTWIKLAQLKAQAERSKEKDLENYITEHAPEDFQTELKFSPPKQINVIPGTHLYKGEIKLQQLWYDDFANPESAKYQILTGNIENSMKELFMNDSTFILSEVISLKEADQFMPHRTIVEFALVFLDNKTTTADVTHALFTSVSQTKRLNGMPVLPNTLKVREFFLTDNSQEYLKTLQQPPHPERIVKHDSIPNEDNPTSTVIRPNFSHIEEETIHSPPVQTFVKPIKTDNIAELKNYMEYQKLAPKEIKKNVTKKQDITNLKPNEKPQYLLRMFFWKDMLARKKRENKLDPTESEIVKLKKKKKNIISHTVAAKVEGENLVIRSRRSQADDKWPISYKGDSQKKSYRHSSDEHFLKRKKRVTDQNEEDLNFSELFHKQGVTDRKNKRDIAITPTAAVDGENKLKIVTNKAIPEEILLRSKRTDENV